MTSDLLAPFEGSRAFQHILSLHDDAGCSRTILLPDLQKHPLQSLLPFLFLVVREEVQLHITGLKVSGNYAQPPDVQTGINLLVEGIKQC